MSCFLVQCHNNKKIREITTFPRRETNKCLSWHFKTVLELYFQYCMSKVIRRIFQECNNDFDFITKTWFAKKKFNNAKNQVLTVPKNLLIFMKWSGFKIQYQHKKAITILTSTILAIKHRILTINTRGFTNCYNHEQVQKNSGQQ